MSGARRVAALGSVLLILWVVSACGRSGDHEVVARVGGDRIDRRTVDHWISVLAGGAAALRSNAQHQPLDHRALSFLISSQWLLGEAEELKVKASDKEA